MNNIYLILKEVLMQKSPKASGLQEIEAIQADISKNDLLILAEKINYIGGIK